jgi:predicted TIM-barrel fold metal-dependent hydrolase
MLTRRSLIVGVSGLCVAAAGAASRFGSEQRSKTTVAFEIPRGACDTHVHVIGDPRNFPMSRDRDYTPAAATTDELLEMLTFLRLDRAVIVTPTVYDGDNSATLAAIRQLGQDRARGVALVDQTTSSGILDSLREAGIAGIRLFLAGAGVFDSAAAARHLKNAISLAEPRAWHLDIATPPDVIAALFPQLASCPVPLVLDTFGWVAGGVEQPGFDQILSLVRTGRAYVKFSEPYRLSQKAPDYRDLVPVVDALLAANPDRLLWGSGWPNVSGPVPGRAKTDLTPNLLIDAGQLLNEFAVWVPDAQIRHKILVENPARLYGF